MEFPESVIWSPSAKEDIDNISHYLLNVWGYKVLSRFISKLNQLLIQIEIIRIFDTRQDPDKLKILF